jgi:excisionase family DNA binding protein
MTKHDARFIAIQETAVYTPNEVQQLLKISSSTFKRLIKNGLIRANKVGGQYRVLGSELMRVVSPAAEEGARKVYRKVKKTAIDVTKDW